MIIFIIALVSCIADKFMCIYLHHAPYFHAIFHVLITLSAHSVIVMYAFVKAESKCTHLKPLLAYWPSFENNEKFEFLCIPYVTFDKHELPKLNKEF